MTSTRDSMRRELRELAKLADAMRSEQDPNLRSSGEWSAAEVRSVESLDAATADSELEHAPGESVVRGSRLAAPAPSASRLSVPPVVESFRPASKTGERSEAARPSRRRSPMFLGMAVIAAAGVLVVSGTVGRSLIKAPSAAAQTGAEGFPSAAGRAPSDALPGPDGPAQPATEATSLAPPSAAPSPPPLQVAPAASALSTPAKKRFVGAAVTPAASRPAVPPVGAKSERAGGASVGKPAGGDSLDDLIRKAVQNPTK